MSEKLRITLALTTQKVSGFQIWTPQMLASKKHPPSLIDGVGVWFFFTLALILLHYFFPLYEPKWRKGRCKKVALLASIHTRAKNQCST